MGGRYLRLRNVWATVVGGGAAAGRGAQASSNARNVKWLDGLRGLASFSVICTHLAHAFDYSLYSLPCDDETSPPRLFQYPILRLWMQGRIGVAIFALMTGFVCGIKPIKQIRASDPTSALKTIAKAGFKRPLRLMIPAVVATLIAFAVCNLGLFYVAGRCDALWIRLSTAQPAGNLGSELARLLRVLRSVWTTGQNPYDDFQWTLLPLLKCSLFVYGVLGALVFVKWRWRVAVYALVFGYFWQDRTPDSETFMCNAFFGLFLSDLCQHPSFQAFLQQKSPIRRLLSCSLILLGLLISSYPKDNANWMQWPIWIEHLNFLFPGGTDLPKRFTALGLITMTTGIVLNNTARVFLASPPLLFLGRYSFAVYLTHGTLFKTVLIWMIYGFTGEPFDDNTKDSSGNVLGVKRISFAGFVFWVPIWIALVYTVAWAWTTYVDAWAERMCARAMETCFEEEEKKGAVAANNMA